MAEAKEIKITLYTDERDANTYVATFIHQQLRGNPNYINNNIIISKFIVLSIRKKIFKRNNNIIQSF